MALSQSLSTGISGLMSHQTAMDNLGHNLANVNTTGFKQGVYQFSNMLHQSIRGGMSADGTTGRGSVNPISMGMGTQTASINKVFTQGNLENTGNPTDLAINGNGFFVLRQGNGYAYTRAGSFHLGEEGYLTSPEGLYVQGTMAVRQSDGTYKIPADAKMQDIVIPIGTVGGQSQTTEVQYSGNLDSTQDVSTGTKLFGKTSFPTVENLQSWMSKDFNGGDNNKADNSWNALEEETFAITRSVYETLTDEQKALISSSRDISVYPDGTVVNLNEKYQDENNNSVDRKCDFVMVTAETVDVNGNTVRAGEVVSTQRLLGQDYADVNDALLNQGLIPMVREINTINGGNVQTSADYGMKVPAFESGSANNYTYPKWFYEATGATMSYEDVRKLNNADFLTAMANGEIWANGMTGITTTPVTSVAQLPAKDNVYAASLNTPLEGLMYKKGTSWVQPFANISNGDEITIDFKKGESQISATFTYNRPSKKAEIAGQIAIDQEKSYTLEHFLKFLAGDVDNPTTACQNISPELFGWFEGALDNEWDSSGYQSALANTALATATNNMDAVGGAMGLLSIPPHISDKNGGAAAYDVPAESAGAYTRTGTTTYPRYDEYGGTIYPDGESFYVSFMSNLGEQNALSDIRITYNDVPHESMFTAETEYAAPQGGSSMVSVDYYDSLGNPKSATVRMAMVSQDNDFTTWRWYADCTEDSDFQWQTDDDGNITSSLSVGTGLIRFDKDGNYVKGAEYSETGGITIDQRNQGVNNPIWIKVLNGLSSSSKQDLDFSRMTCTAAEPDFKLYHQNGRAPGTLKEFAVSLDGVIQGMYDNGNVVDLARVGLAMIPNQTGLICAGGNIFYTGPASGDALYGHAGTGGLGDLHQSQLETSNVELSVEFTKLITIERGFQANSRTITTADEMIQELLNLKR